MLLTHPPDEDPRTCQSQQTVLHNATKCIHRSILTPSMIPRSFRGSPVERGFPSLLALVPALNLVQQHPEPPFVYVLLREGSEETGELGVKHRKDVTSPPARQQERPSTTSERDEGTRHVKFLP